MTRTSLSAVILLLLLTVMAQVGLHMVSATEAIGPYTDEWDEYSLDRPSRGFRFGGADRFSHGFGRRRRVDDTINPLL